MLLNLRDLCGKYQFGITGIIHVGGHHGEEAEIYDGLTSGIIHWIDGQEEHCEAMRHKFAGRENRHRVYQRWLSDAVRFGVPLYEASNGESTSIKEPGLHTVHHPHITFAQRRQVPTDTLDRFVVHTLSVPDAAKVNFLVMDAQGAEGDILRGATGLLPQLQAVYLEINIRQVYRDIVLLSDLDAELRRYGFLRLDTYLTGANWGDAFFYKL